MDKAAEASRKAHEAADQAVGAGRKATAAAKLAGEALTAEADKE